MADGKKAKFAKRSARTSRKKTRTSVARSSVKPIPSEPLPREDRNSGPSPKRSPTKRETVLAMLCQPKGTTVAAIVKATGWQKHSVRGFLAGVVKRKLKLKLESAMSDNQRVYRIAKPGAAS
jgi:hypothetical protein